MASIDTAALRRRYPLPETVSRYGVALRRCGCALVGRCPFHDDRGRPNLYVYTDRDSWRCYRCGAGGDVIAFVQRSEGLGFLAAVRRLDRDPPLSRPALHPLPCPRPHGPRRPFDGVELACLAAAVECYHQRLLASRPALAYLAGRGVSLDAIDRWRLGYAAGDELASALHRRGLSVAAAVRCGLLLSNGQERLAGRIVIPELRNGRPVWAIGRTLRAGERPKYLGLPGPKPLLGWDSSRGAARAVVVEGPFDWLVLRQWGYPALALLGAHASAAVLATLRTVLQVDVLLDNDAAGQEAASRLAAQLGPRATVRTLPGVKDAGDLARHPDGRAILAAVLGTPQLAQAA